MSSPERSTRIVKLKVCLLDINPMIRRRVLVPESVTLCGLCMWLGVWWQPSRTLSRRQALPPHRRADSGPERQMSSQRFGVGTPKTLQTV